MKYTYLLPFIIRYFFHKSLQYINYFKINIKYSIIIVVKCYLTKGNPFHLIFFVLIPT